MNCCVILLCVKVSVAQNLIIRHATVLTVTQGTKQDADILITNGKIADIGKAIKAPVSHKVIDGTGLFVMPGIIDAHSHITLEAVNEATNPITPELKMYDAVNPLDLSIYRALAGGVTTIHALHGSANVIGGQCATLKLRYGVTDPELLKMKDAPRTIKFALGENPTKIHGANNLIPKTRMGVEFVIRKAFSEAREYHNAWETYHNSRLKKGHATTPPVYSERLETLVQILKGNIIIHCHSYRADEIQMLMRVCRDFGVRKLVFQHGNEGFKVAPELAHFGAMASVFADEWAYKFEVYYSSAYNAAILTRNGVITSINSDDPETIRHLYHEAAKSQKYGKLSDDEALALITINPAKQLGIDDRVGSIEKNKDADLALFSAHPLSVYTIPVMTIVDGVIKFDRTHDADDQRIYIDPEMEIDRMPHEDEHAEDQCMIGSEGRHSDQ